MSLPKEARIEICGGIASGKTSLALALQRAGFRADFERFQQNPFYEAFYADPHGNAFETEITFLLQHFHQLKRHGRDGLLSVFDFGLALDLAYSRVTLGDRDREVFDNVFAAVVGKVGAPSLVVRLRCAVTVERSRIQDRGRIAERGMSLEYLEALESALDVVLGQNPFHSVPRVELDSEHINFVRDPNGVSHAVKIVSQALEELAT